MNSLKKVYLARNEFTGKIPKSLVALPKLMELNLEGNRFEGKRPNFRSNGWKVFNLAGNQLEGPIPKSLSTMNSSSFVGKLISLFDVHMLGIDYKDINACSSSLACYYNDHVYICIFHSLISKVRLPGSTVKYYIFRHCIRSTCSVFSRD